jgi:tripartite-type tricarboxylate transporter receptor subunit TctC
MRKSHSEHFSTAGGSLGADTVAKSAPDGRTLLMGTVGTHAINSALYKKLPYDAVRDFTPIALVGDGPGDDCRASFPAGEQYC